MKKLVLLLFIAFAFCFHAAAQAVFSSEDDLKKQANKLFEEEEFGKAYPLFSQLLSLYPKDAQYNYKFGTCLLFASNDKEKAIPYIEYAAKRQKQDVDKEVFFYLGKAYHLNYRFADAIRSYTVYKGMASSKQTGRYDVERQLEMCENGKKLLKSVTELSVLEKKEVPISDFFRSYNLSEFNAKLIVKPDDLKTSTDKKKKDESLMYLAPDRNQIYYSSYGEDGKTGRDIYFVTRTSGGDLSKPTRVGDAVNTKYDEDYAFLHPNGRALYFCSKGHNSMGGYDIFRSEWDNGTQAWGKAVNMDFAINTPDDDILFISDAEDKSAYFSSRRESPDGRITVYKIKLDRKPLDLAIITGTLTKTVGDRMAKATITVSKILKDEVVGVFNTNAADGSYTLKLPNGGKFMLAVESAGFKKSSELVVVPNQQEIKPLKQEITLVNEDGQDKILIKNDFDAQVDSADMQQAIAFIKAKASLEVSPAEEEIKSVAVEETTNTASSDPKTETKKTTPVNNNDIIEMSYQDAKETQKDANELLKNSEAAKLLSRQKNEQSIQKYNEAMELMKTAETLTNPEEKMTQSNRAAATRKESEMLSQESVLSLNLSNQMENQAIAKQTQADAELKYAKDLDNAIKAGANEAKMNDLLARKEELDKKSEVLDSSYPPDLNKEINASQALASKSMAKYIDIQQDVEDLETEAKRLRAEAEKTKNDGVKQNLTQQAEEMEKEAETKKKDAETYSATAKKQQSQADSLKNNASLTASVMKQIEGSPEVIAANTPPTPTNTVVTSSVVNETATTTSPETTSTTAPLVIKSSYVDVFVNQMHDAEKKTNELEKEQTLAVVYQSWTDSLDNQIASLKQQMGATTVDAHKTQIQNKIYELQSSVDDKRQKAADSRNKVDNLKLQQALADASTVTPTTTNTTTTTASSTTTTTVPETTTSSTAAEPENVTGAKEINSLYQNKITENAKISNEYEKKFKEQVLYEEWAASLYDESQRLRKDGKGNRADDALAESKTKQALAIQSADEVTRIKAEKPELVATANLAPTETTTMMAPDPAKTNTVAVNVNAATTTTTAATSPETTTAATNTVTTVPETTTSVTPANTTTTATTTASANTTQPSVQKTLPTTPPASLTHKDEYTRFVALKNESVWAKNNADRQFKQAEEAQSQADKQFKESQELSDQILKTSDPNDQKNLKNISDILDRSALKNQAKADSIKALARNSEAESNSKRTESDLYLQSLDRAAYEEISTATGVIPIAIGTETMASKTTPSETKTETTTESTTPAVNTTSVSVPDETTTTKTETSTKETNTAATNSVSPTSTTATETVKTNTVTETSSTTPETTTTKTENTTEPVKNETAVTKTENTTEPVKNETTATTKTENTTEPVKNETATTTTENTTTPVNPATTKTETGTAPVNTSSPSSETMKYYDALFDRLELEGTSYSSSKPIPVDAPMPEGLIFKVQIGAFKNAIPQNLFKGIKPITAETTPQGLKRYTAGLFQKFSVANAAKKQVNDLGYRDAFVVAFFNGKRISMNEAMAKAKDAGETIDPAAISTSSTSSSTSTSTTSASTSAQGTNIANATDVKSVSGLFYTIQIGVFSRPVTSAQLYDISPINSERTDNGMIRYTTGRFSSEATAVRAKNSIAAKGISDAFVIAYRDGKRIGLSSAKSMIDSEGGTILAKDKQEYSIIPSDTTTSEASSKALTSGATLGIVFKVQVGAFKEQVPIAIANKLVANSSRGIKTFRDPSGLLVYTIGEFMEYESANNLKNELVSKGLNDAFVIAFKDGKKITATAALEMIRNK